LGMRGITPEHYDLGGERSDIGEGGEGVVGQLLGLRGARKRALEGGDRPVKDRLKKKNTKKKKKKTEGKSKEKSSAKQETMTGTGPGIQPKSGKKKGQEKSCHLTQ